MRILKVLVACEESQAVTKEFRALGHESYSCDLLPCSGGHIEWHIQHDVIDIINSKIFYTTDKNKHSVHEWDLIIAFPPCTDLAVSGARWFPEKIKNGSQKRSIDFFLIFANYDGAIAIENPIGIMSSNYKKPDQIIQPWMFGDLASKSTCLWLNKLPKLKPYTSEKPEMEYWVGPTGKRMEKWMYDIRCKDAKSGLRAKLASKTFPGIAKAMATQWSEFILNGESIEPSHKPQLALL
jgi:site-specific DNA-cytosine methylase